MAKRYFESKSQMKEYSSMIREDRQAPCLLPRDVIDKYWDMAPRYDLGAIKKDLFQGAQEQLKTDAADIKKIFKPGKY